MSHLFADHGYTGDPLKQWLKAYLNWEIEIVPKETNDSHRSGCSSMELVLERQPKGGFQVQRRRWVIERTFAWKWACS